MANLLTQLQTVPLLVSGGGAEATAGQNPLSGILSLLGALLVLGLVLFLAYKSSRWLGSRYGVQSLRGSHMEVLERVVLAPDRFLVLVRLRGRVLLLGVTAQRIETLAQLDPADYSDLTPPAAPSSPAADSFAALLRDAVGGFAAKTPKKDDRHE